MLGSGVLLGTFVGRREVAVADEGQGDGSSSTGGAGSPQAIKTNNSNMARGTYVRDSGIEF
jgi:hypothetical protein